MQDIIADLGIDLGSMYHGLLKTFLTNLLGTFFLIFLIRIGYELVSMIFPGIRSLVYFLFKPFRLLHVWFHIQAAKNLNEKARRENPTRAKKVNVGVLFSTGMSSSSEKSTVAIASGYDADLSVKDAISIANAPLFPALLMLFFLVLIAPVMTEGLLVFIHMYFLVGITLVLFPSGQDSIFIFNTILTQSNVSAWYMVFPFISFCLTAVLYSLKYQFYGVYPPFWWIEPFVMGLYSTWLYLMLLAAVIWLTSTKDSDEPTLGPTEKISSIDPDGVLLEQQIRNQRSQQDQIQVWDLWDQI